VSGGDESQMEGVNVIVGVHGLGGMFGNDRGSETWFWRYRAISNHCVL